MEGSRPSWIVEGLPHLPESASMFMLQLPPPFGMAGILLIYGDFGDGLLGLPWLTALLKTH